MGVTIGLVIAVIVTGVIVYWSLGGFDKTKNDDDIDWYGM